MPGDYARVCADMPALRLRKDGDHAHRRLQFYHECENCKLLLRPKRGDCCVFCSYGSVSCPPAQESARCR